MYDNSYKILEFLYDLIIINILCPVYNKTFVNQ